MRFRIVSTLALALALAACNGSQNPSGGADGAPKEDLGTVLAEVGDVKVYSKEFEQAAARKTPADGQNFTIDEKKDILKKLVEEKALYLEARKKGVDQDPKVQKVMINTLLRQEVYASVRNSDIAEDELKAYFDSHKEEFIVPPKVQVKRIFVRVSDQRSDADAKKLIDGLYAQVKASPDKFGDIASESSEDPYKKRGGDLGFVSKEGKPGIEQEVVDKAFGMNVGDLSEPFLAGGGYNVIYVANKREGVERTFEQMRSSVIRRVKNDKYKELYDKYVADISKNYPAKIDDAALGKVEVQPMRQGGMNPLGFPGGEGEGMEGAPEGMMGGEAGGPPGMRMPMPMPVAPPPGK